MTIEAMLAVLAVVAGGIWKLIKEMPEIRRGRRKALQEDFAFSEAFFAKLATGQMHPAARERGLQALAGHGDVRGAEVELILRISAESEVMNYFVAGRGHLQLESEHAQDRFTFRQGRHTKIRRWLWKAGFFALYAAAFAGATLPLLFSFLRHAVSGEQLLFSVFLMAAAFWFASEGIEIAGAERVMEAQAKSLQFQQQDQDTDDRD